jgi:DNA processing protein
MSDSRLTLGVSLLPGLRGRERLLLADLLPDFCSFQSLSPGAVNEMVGRAVNPDRRAMAEAVSAVDPILDLCRRKEIQLIPYWSDHYPALLREIFDPPVLLYLRGSLPDSSRPTVAVVGTRKPDRNSVSAAFSLSAELALSGIPVVSGLARGIDKAAHEGACRAGGYTLAVLGSGVDVIYPASHGELVKRILDAGGGLVSEYPPGTAPLRYHFPARNRILSGICRSTVVIVAPEKSGSLITADFALDQGRDLFVHLSGAGAADLPSSTGTSRLHEEGAPLVEHSSDIFNYWGWKQSDVPWILWRRTERTEMLASAVQDELEDKTLYYEGSWYYRTAAIRKEA